MALKTGIGLLGYGNVGSGVLKYFMTADDSRLEEFEIRTIGVSEDRQREGPLGSVFFKRSGVLETPKFISGEKKILEELINNQDIDIVVDTIGGSENADKTSLKYMEAALKKGKHVITSNKANVAQNLSRLTQIANSKGVNFRYEGCVCGGIPIIKNLEDYFARDEITKVVGIINGTSNYILTRMHEGMSFEDALKQAQEKGYAEKDPSNDVLGRDAASKLAILASLAFKTDISPKSISVVEGINSLTTEDIYAVTKMISEDDGKAFQIRALAVAEVADGGLDLRVHPAYISQDHPLFGTNEAVNAVSITGRHSGTYTFKGPGAGSNPTSFAVWSDIFKAGECLDSRVENFSDFGNSCRIVNNSRTNGYLISVSPEYKIGVFKEKIGIVADSGIDICQIRNFPRTMTRGTDSLLPDIICIEDSEERAVRKVISDLKKAKSVVGEPRYVRRDSMK